MAPAPKRPGPGWSVPGGGGATAAGKGSGRDPGTAQIERWRAAVWAGNLRGKTREDVGRDAAVRRCRRLLLSAYPLSS